MRTPIVLCCAYLAFMLAGCAGSIAPSQLEPPAAALLSPPRPLVDPKEGDDIVQLHIDARRRFATETDKYRRLQKYVRTILGRGQ